MCIKKYEAYITLHVTTIIMYNFTLTWNEKKQQRTFQHNLLLQIFHSLQKKKSKIILC
jgi:hypothetical protein